MRKPTPERTLPRSDAENGAHVSISGVALDPVLEGTDRRVDHAQTFCKAVEQATAVRIAAASGVGDLFCFNAWYIVSLTLCKYPAAFGTAGHHECFQLLCDLLQG